MQQYTPRPSLQPTQRPTGATDAFNRQPVVRVPQRPQGPADHTAARGFEPPHSNPSSYGHYSASGEQPQRTPTFAGTTQALFAAPTLDQTPYQQMYHLDPIRQRRQHHFPFRALMILLVVGAMSFGAYAVYRAFTNPAPANAELPYNAHNDPELGP
jgi:hypothetical protein